MGRYLILDCGGIETVDGLKLSENCIDGLQVKSYAEIEGNPEVAEFDPGSLCADGQVHVPIICIHCHRKAVGWKEEE